MSESFDDNLDELTYEELKSLGEDLGFHTTLEYRREELLQIVRKRFEEKAEMSKKKKWRNWKGLGLGLGSVVGALGGYYVALEYGTGMGKILVGLASLLLLVVGLLLTLGSLIGIVQKLFGKNAD